MSLKNVLNLDLLFPQTAHRYRPESSLAEHASINSASVVQEEIFRLQEERRLLKDEIILLRDENSQLLTRNQVLVHEVERGKLDTKKLTEKVNYCPPSVFALGCHRLTQSKLDFLLTGQLLYMLLHVWIRD